MAALKKSHLQFLLKARQKAQKAGQNAEKPGPSDRTFSKPPLDDLDEALELLSGEN